jgi:hypothetical protein
MTTGAASMSTSNATSSVLQKWLDKPGWVDVVKHRWLYLGASLLFLVPGLVFIGLSIRDYPNPRRRWPNPRYLHPARVDWVGGPIARWYVSGGPQCVNG